MIEVKYTPKGVIIKLSRPVPNGFVSEQTMLTKPQELEKLIGQLQEAKVSLVEHQARSAEEGKSQLWESV